MQSSNGWNFLCVLCFYMKTQLFLSALYLLLQAHWKCIAPSLNLEGGSGSVQQQIEGCTIGLENDVEFGFSIILICVFYRYVPRKVHRYVP